MNPRKCRICQEPYTPTQPMQRVCSIACAIILANNTAEKLKAANAKRERTELRRAKAKAKTRAQLAREAQTAFNRYIRARDAGQPCISCGTLNPRQWHAGHYRTTKAAPELRFHPLNAHRQCSQCNDHLSGNISMYRPALIARIGQQAVDWLEGPHKARHYSIEDLIEIKAGFNAWARELEQSA